jgi:hypothetical protein
MHYLNRVEGAKLRASLRWKMEDGKWKMEKGWAPDLVPKPYGEGAKKLSS